MTVTKQWFQHGDHNGVTHYKNLNGDGGSYCHKCDEAVPKHGWINEGGHRVCPADWIIEAANGTFYPVKTDVFAEFAQANTELLNTAKAVIECLDSPFGIARYGKVYPLDESLLIDLEKSLKRGKL